MLKQKTSLVRSWRRCKAKGRMSDVVQNKRVDLEDWREQQKKELYDSKGSFPTGYISYFSICFKNLSCFSFKKNTNSVGMKNFIMVEKVFEVFEEKVNKKVFYNLEDDFLLLGFVSNLDSFLMTQNEKRVDVFIASMI